MCNGVSLSMPFLHDMIDRCHWWFQRLPSRVSVDAVAVSGFCLKRQVWSIRWEEIDCIWVETTDEGPERDNCFLMLQAGTSTYRIPSETPGFPNVATALPMFLKNVDEKLLMQGLGFCEDGEFVVYRRATTDGAAHDIKPAEDQ